MATTIIVEVEGDDTDPQRTAKEAAEYLAVAFHTIVSARLIEVPDTPIKFVWTFDSLGNPAGSRRGFKDG